MRALRFTLILFGLIFFVVAGLAVWSTMQPRAAELVVESANGTTVKTINETKNNTDPYDSYMAPLAEASPQPT